jgi:tight adherence protein B
VTAGTAATAALVTACLLLAALAVAWPTRPQRARLRALMPPDYGPRQAGGGAPTTGGPARWAPIATTLLRSRASSALPVVAAVLVMGALGGVVAGLVTAAYGTLAVRAVTSRAKERARAARRRELLDQLTGAASDLRAGLPTGAAIPGDPDPQPDPGPHTDPGPDPHPDRSRDLLRTRVRAAAGLAERTGAPLAELLDRIEADARAGDRARVSAGAQAAGAQATAWLLAGLPAGGLALGYVIGADPLQVLLHTPIGAVCALGAVALQMAGLAWSRRIMRAGGALG